MANYNLTNQTISSSFQQLLQKDTDTGNLVDGLGNPIDGLTINGTETIYNGDLILSQSVVPAQGFTKGIVYKANTDLETDITLKPSGSVVYQGLELDSNLKANKFFGDGSGLTNITAVVELPSGVVSGSSQVVLEDTTYTDNGVDSFLRTDGAGNLSFEYVQSVYETIRNMTGAPLAKGTPVYISGSTGDNGNAYIALASDTTKMPATYVAGEDLGIGETGLALVSGKVSGVDTSGYPAGTMIYVGESGGWTDTRPSGSNSVVQVLGVVQKEGVGGQGVLINQLETVLPNIQEGYAWVGDSGNQPIAVSTASWDAHSDLTQLNLFTQSQEQLNTTFATTGSNSFVGDQNVDGTIDSTATIKSEYRLQVDNPLTTPNYLMLAQDSGSARFAVTNDAGAGALGANMIVYGSSLLNGPLNISDNNFTITSGSNSVEFNSKFSDGQAGVVFTAENSKFNSTGNFNIQVSGIAAIDASAGINLNNDTTVNANTTLNGTVNVNTNFINHDDTNGLAAYLQNPQFFSEYYGSGLVWQPNASGGQTRLMLGEKAKAELQLNAFDTGYDNTLYIRSTAEGTTFSDWITPSYTETTWLKVPQQETPAFQRGLDITGSLSVTGSLNVVGNQTLDGTITSTGTVKSEYRLWVDNPLTNPQYLMLAQESGSARFAITNDAGAGALGANMIVYGSSQLLGTVSVSETLKLEAQDPLPTGELGMLAVSGSDLYFHNGTNWVAK